jgi:hypothetical protein
MAILRFQLPCYEYTAGGHRLDRYEVRNVTGSEAQRVYVCAAPYLLSQIKAVLEAKRGRSLPLRDEDAKKWNGRIELPDGLTDEQRAHLDILKDNLTVQADDLECVMGLDFYNNPVENEDDGNGETEWVHSTAGELINKLKYRGHEAPLEKLAERLSGVATNHLILARAEVVISVPGRDKSMRPGERLAKAVAARLDVPYLRTRGVSAQRPEAKAREAGGEEIDYAAEYVVDDAVRGRPVMVVDDVYRSGKSMRAVSRLARAAGATSVVGLVAARTRRLR